MAVPLTRAVLAPETERWLTTPVRPGTPVVVAGVAGGVGTTTVAALLWTALHAARPGRVGMLDRSGGSFATLVGEGAGAVADGSADLVVQDLGPHALTPGAEALDPAGRVVVVVCGAHRDGLRSAAEALRGLAARTGQDATRRTVVVPVAAVGRTRGSVPLLAQAREAGLGGAVVPLRRDRTLAARGVLPAADDVRGLLPHREATALAAEVMRCARWVAAVGDGSTP